jgi:hypothetical protein
MRPLAATPFAHLRALQSCSTIYRAPAEIAVRVYFHLKDGHGVIRDPEGVEVADLQAARVQAIQAIEELRQEDASASRDWSGWTLEVADGSGAALFSLDLASRFP